MRCYVDRYMSPLGRITMSADDIGVTGLWFDGQEHFGTRIRKDPVEEDTDALKEASGWLNVYFSGGIPKAIPSLHLTGTPFQEEVWSILLTIPYGETMTYGSIAATIESRRASRVSARAVGGAVGRNPVSLIVPCHRVVGSDGSLTGYAGGVERKRQLLEIEKNGGCHRRRMAAADSVHMRRATMDDLDASYGLMEQAKTFFKDSGVDMWQHGYPSYRDIATDISSGEAYVCILENEVVGYICVHIGPEPFQDTLRGTWTDDRPAVFHRSVADSGHRHAGI